MDEIIAPWAEFASLPMYDDGEITWWTKGKSSFLEKTLDSLEQEIGVNLTRVKTKRDAEIRHKKVKSFDNPFQLGNAYWHPNNPVWKLKTKRGKKHKSTQIHEFGHALGLQHPVDHFANKNTIMSYQRDRTISNFFERDKQAIKRIYTDQSLEFADAKAWPINIDELTGILNVDYI
jgi:hypothetical protein